MGILDSLKDKLLGKYIGSWTRHALTALAGLLAASTWPGAKEFADLILANLDQFGGAIGAALAAAVGLAWSMKEKQDKK